MSAVSTISASAPFVPAAVAPAGEASSIITESCVCGSGADGNPLDGASIFKWHRSVRPSAFSPFKAVTTVSAIAFSTKTISATTVGWLVTIRQALVAPGPAISTSTFCMSAAVVPIWKLLA